MPSTVVSAAVPLISVLLGALVTYRVNVRSRRRSSAEDLVDAAISAVAVAEANQSLSSRVKPPPGFDHDEADNLRQRLIWTAIENHNVRTHEAREALAKVIVLDSRVREYYLDPDAVFDRPQEIIHLLTEVRDHLSPPARRVRMRRTLKIGSD
ncbi:MAG: hypothetical protein JWL97_3839 [Gemmatimonadales bacterium]|jgi:hypothetical protein|nr:hypothetical protein [Gemmatimonadales bacterium]